MPPLAIAAAIGVAGSLGGAAISSSAAGHAADTQSQAAMYAADKQAASAKEALDFTKKQWGIGQQEMAPWLYTGLGANVNLARLLGLNVSGTGYVPFSPVSSDSPVATPRQNVPLNRLTDDMPMGGGRNSGLRVGGTVAMPGTAGKTTTPGSATSNTIQLSSLINPALGAQGSLLDKFQAPTDVTEKNDPGYQFRLKEGMNALEKSAAAKGNLFSGTQGRALQQFGQDYASNEYDKVYGRAWNEFQTDQTNKFNRLAALSGIGQTTGASLLNAGQNTANSVSDLLTYLGNSQAQGINNSAAAKASGYIGSANAWSGGLNGASNSIADYVLLSKLLKPGGGGSVPGFGDTMGWS